MPDTGPVPQTRTCGDCTAAVAWLWSPRINRGTGGWVAFERVGEDPATIRPHRCGTETPDPDPPTPNWPQVRADQADTNHRGRLRVQAALALRAGARPTSTEEIQ